MEITTKSAEKAEEAFRKRIVSFYAENVRLQKQVDAQDDEICRLQKKLSKQLEEHKDAYDKLKAEAKRNCMAKNEESMRYEMKLEDQQRELEAKAIELEKLKEGVMRKGSSTVMQLRRQLDDQKYAHIKAMSDVENRLTEKERDFDLLKCLKETELEESAMKIERLQGEIERFQCNPLGYVEEKNKGVYEAKYEMLNSLKRQVAEIENQLQYNEDPEIKKQKGEAKFQLESSIKSMESELIALNPFKSREKKDDAQKIELELLQKDFCEQLDSQKAAFEEEKKEIQSELKSARDATEAKENEIDILTVQLDSLRRKVKSSYAAAAAAAEKKSEEIPTTELELLRKEVRRARTKIHSINKAEDNSQDEDISVLAEDADINLKSAQDDAVISFRLTMLKLAKEIATVGEGAEEQQRETSKLQNQIEETNQRLEKREKEMSGLKGHMANTQSDISAKDKRIVELTNESKEKDVRINKLEEELSSAREALVTLLSAKDRIISKQKEELKEKSEENNVRNEKRFDIKPSVEDLSTQI